MVPDLPPIAQAQSIEEVIEILEQVVAWSIANDNRLGYFPALYQLVTVKVKEGCDTGYFDNPERMRKLDVIFANRYLAALEAYRLGKPTSHVWQIAFAATPRYWPLVLQHLMLGMNAHINLDLGVAAAEVAPGDQINALEGDFTKINLVLNDQIDEVEAALAKTWPPLALLGKLLGKTDEKIAAFSMKVARKEAWKVALKAAALQGTALDAYIKERDEQMIWLARKLQNPGRLISFAILPII